MSDSKRWLVDQGERFDRRRREREIIISDFLAVMEKLNMKDIGLEWYCQQGLCDLMAKIEWEKIYR